MINQLVFEMDMMCMSVGISNTPVFMFWWAICLCKCLVHDEGELTGADSSKLAIRP